MLRRIQISNFKSLREIRLELGGLNLFIGTNASGKSNFFDALRVLQGIGYGFTVDEIFNGKPKSDTSEVWEPIRGGSTKAAFAYILPDHDDEETIESDIDLAVRIESPLLKSHLDYTVSFSWQSLTIQRERLSYGSEGFIYESTSQETDSQVGIEVRYDRKTRGPRPRTSFEKSRPVLHQYLRSKFCTQDHRQKIDACIRALSNTQRIDPTPHILREYSLAHQVKRMGERGENFAALIQSILDNPKAKDAYMSWLKKLLPGDIDDIVVLKGAVQEPLFAIMEGGVTFPAKVLSDGTLRFSAIAAACFQPDMPGILTIEEIENGIHPTRLRLLVELLRSKAGPEFQIMASTHSPIVLAWLQESDYRTTFFCRRDEITKESKIAPLADVPNFTAIVRNQPISDLFVEGWLEAAP